MYVRSPPLVLCLLCISSSWTRASFTPAQCLVDNLTFSQLLILDIDDFEEQGKITREEAKALRKKIALVDID
jgi:hypothetical protein